MLVDMIQKWAPSKKICPAYRWTIANINNGFLQLVYVVLDLLPRKILEKDFAVAFHEQDVETASLKERISHCKIGVAASTSCSFSALQMSNSKKHPRPATLYDDCFDIEMPFVQSNVALWPIMMTTFATKVGALNLFWRDTVHFGHAAANAAQYLRTSESLIKSQNELACLVLWYRSLFTLPTYNRFGRKQISDKRVNVQKSS